MADILIVNNNLKLSEDGDFILVDGIDMLKQHIIVALNTFYGDWILDTEKGIDYVGGFKDTGFLEDDLKQQILSVEGVRYINNFKVSFDKLNRLINVLAVISTIYGELYINETLNNRN